MGIFNRLKSALGYGVKKTTEDVADSVRLLIGAAKEADKFLAGASKGFEEGMIKPSAELLFGPEGGDRSAQFVPKSKAELLGQTLTEPSKYLTPGLKNLGVPAPLAFTAGLVADIAVPGPEIGLGARVEGKIAKELDPLLSEARKFKTAEEFVAAKVAPLDYGVSYKDSVKNGEEYLVPSDKLKSYVTGLSNEGGKSLSGKGAISVEVDAEGGLHILDGNNRAQQAIEDGFTHIPAKVIFDKGAPRDLLTKSQLTSLWEQAQKGATAGKVAQESRMAGKATTELAQRLPGQVPESIVPQKVPQVGGGGSLPPSIPPSGKKSIGDLMQGAVDRLSAAIRESAKPARGVLEEQYAAERARRTAKLASIQERGGSLPQQLGALKGELVAPEKKMFGGINLIEEDVKTLFNAANFNPQLDVYEKLNTQTALSKLLQGIIPTNSELALLQKTYGDNLVKIILDKRSAGQKILSGLGELANLPRSIMSSVDLSAPFRQGLALISHPKAFGNAFLSMFSQFGSEKAFKAVQEGIAQMPDYQLMKQGKLALTDVGTMLTGREERFMSNWAEKLPVAGHLIRASGRAYVGFLNKLRADVFTDIISGVRASGRKLDAPLIEAIGDFVNTASGRGSKLFGHVPVGNAMPLLNGLFFSPRLMASRTTLLNPVKYVTADPVVRKEMLKSLFSVLGAGLTMMGLAKMAGAKVGDNPTSSDFGKIIAGNTRIDPWGGFQQYVRMAAQLWTGKYTSTTTGKQFTLGEGYKPITRFDILWRQIESKEAPIASFITDLLRQQDYKGDPVSVKKEIADRFKPMMVSDLYDVYKDNPSLLPLGILSAFGVGIQTYAPKKGVFQSKLKTPIRTKEYKPKVSPFKSKLK